MNFLEMVYARHASGHRIKNIRFTFKLLIL